MYRVCSMSRSAVKWDLDFIFVLSLIAAMFDDTLFEGRQISVQLNKMQHRQQQRFWTMNDIKYKFYVYVYNNYTRLYIYKL